ncbi:MAG: hypothetical protein ACTTH7_06755 [Treponema sp.]
MEKIQSIQKSKTIDYSDKPVERFWLECTTGLQKQTVDYRTSLIEALNKSTNSVICVQTEQIDDFKLIEALHAASRTNRIYILTNAKPSALKDVSGCCLLRYGVRNIGSFILINAGLQNPSGYLFTAPFLESSFASDNIMIELDSAQIKTLFRFFCNTFWNKALYQIIDDFNLDKLVEKSPLNFLPNMNDFSSESYVRKECAVPAKQAILMVPEVLSGQLIDYSTVTDSTIIIQFGNSDEQALMEINKNKNTLYAIKNMYAQLLLTENGKSFLIPKPYISETDTIFALELNDRQKDILIRELCFCIDNPEYCYLHSGKRSEYPGRTIYFTSDTKKAVHIKAQSDIGLSAVSCTRLFERDLFEQQEPQFQDDGVSCTITYTWEIIPFFLPDGAKKAPLYDEWKGIAQRFKDTCKLLMQDVEDAGKWNITERLKRFFLGKNQKFTQYKKRLDELETKQLSTLEKIERKNIINTVNEIRHNISSDKKDIDNEIKKAAIDDTIADLEHKKIIKEKELSGLQESSHNKLQEKEAEIHALQKELAELEKERETVTQQHREERNAPKGGCFQDTDISKADTTAFFRQRITLLEQKCDELKQHITRKEEECTILKSKYAHDEKSIHGSIEKLKRDIEQKYKEKERIGKDTEISQENESSLNVFTKNVKKSNTKCMAFTIPDDLEPLPKVGTLYEFKGTPYLEIAFWEEYQAGQEECKRFNAQLCAKEYT